MSRVAEVKFTDYTSSVNKALDLIHASEVLPEKGLIIIKPNLTNASPPPVTTNVRMTEAVLMYVRKHTQAEIAVGEGCGSGRTEDTFAANGYAEMATRNKIDLIDFNAEPAECIKRSDTMQLSEFYIPAIAIDAFIISVPVLKDHSFTETTIAMKNMFGLAPEPFYSGSWNKSKLHSPSTHNSVVDLCLYKKPGMSVVDASTALSGMHLAGTEKKLNRILASIDPVAVDAVGTRLMQHDPKKVEYLRLAQQKGLGSLDDIEIIS